MKELEKNELMSLDGGLVPMAYYTNDATIAQNGKLVSAGGSFIYGFICGLLGL